MKSIKRSAQLTALILGAFSGVSVLGASKAPAWNILIPAIKYGDVAKVMSIVPSQISLTDTTQPGNRTPEKILTYHNKQWDAINSYFSSLAQNTDKSNATDDDWDALIGNTGKKIKSALNEGDLKTVMSIVPSKIGPDATTKSGRVVRKIPQFLRGKGAEIQNHFNSLNVGAAGPAAGMPSGAPTSAAGAAGHQEFRFYNKGEVGYEHTNFYNGQPNITTTPGLAGGINFMLRLLDPDLGWTDFPSSEHAFQIRKYDGQPAIKRELLAIKEPGKLFYHINRDPVNSPRLRALIQPGWLQMRDKVMQEVVDAKYDQNPQLAAALMALAGQELVEASPWDDYWGDPSRAVPVAGGKTNKGQNKLGTTLEQTRDRLLKAATAAPAVPQAPKPKPKPKAAAKKAAAKKAAGKAKSGPKSGPAPKKQEEKKKSEAAAQWTADHQQIADMLNNLVAYHYAGQFDAIKALKGLNGAIDKVKLMTYGARSAPDPDTGVALATLVKNIKPHFQPYPLIQSKLMELGKALVSLQ